MKTTFDELKDGDMHVNHLNYPSITGKQSKVCKNYLLIVRLNLVSSMSKDVER